MATAYAQEFLDDVGPEPVDVPAGSALMGHEGPYDDDTQGPLGRSVDVGHACRRDCQGQHPTEVLQLVSPDPGKPLVEHLIVPNPSQGSEKHATGLTVGEPSHEATKLDHQQIRAPRLPFRGDP